MPLGHLKSLEAKQPGFTAALPLLLFAGLLWGQLALALQPWWADGSYYDYGWLVPFLCLWCLWARWEHLDPASRNLHPGTPTLLQALGLTVIILALSAVRVIEQSDPLWRVPIWTHALTVVLIWHLILHQLTRRTWYFLPVTILALTAVPLPPFAEGALIQRLTAAVLTYSVPFAHLLGLPVEMAGNALTAEGRILRIDDGCSGIRSFQSLLMISIFFGEFFLLSWPKRLGMLATGFAAGFVFNGLRTLTLTWIFFRRGEELFHEFHDGVGIVTFCLSAIATYLVAWFLAASPKSGAQGSSNH
jgi:exosortase